MTDKITSLDQLHDYVGSPERNLLNLTGPSGNRQCLAIKRYSDHPQDDYLYIGLFVKHAECPDDNNEYVVWTLNTSTPCVGYSGGDYFERPHDQEWLAEKEAMECFNRRGRLLRG